MARFVFVFGRFGGATLRSAGGAPREELFGQA